MGHLRVRWNIRGARAATSTMKSSERRPTQPTHLTMLKHTRKQSVPGYESGRKRS